MKKVDWEAGLIDGVANELRIFFKKFESLCANKSDFDGERITIEKIEEVRFQIFIVEHWEWTQVNGNRGGRVKRSKRWKSMRMHKKRIQGFVFLTRTLQMKIVE